MVKKESSDLIMTLIKIGLITLAGYIIIKIILSFTK
jgi:hypothetical protein